MNNLQYSTSVSIGRSFVNVIFKLCISVCLHFFDLNAANFGVCARSGKSKKAYTMQIIMGHCVETTNCTYVNKQPSNPIVSRRYFQTPRRCSPLFTFLRCKRDKFRHLAKLQKTLIHLRCKLRRDIVSNRLLTIFSNLTRLVFVYISSIQTRWISSCVH